LISIKTSTKKTGVLKFHIDFFMAWFSKLLVFRVIKVSSFIETIIRGWQNILGFTAVLMLQLFSLKINGLSNTTIH